MSDYNAYLKRMEARTRQQSASAIELTTLERSFNVLASVHGSLVPLSALRNVLGGTRRSQDATITHARVSGQYTLTPCDRYTTPELIAGQYTDSFGDTFHYISVRE